MNSKMGGSSTTLKLRLGILLIVFTAMAVALAFRSFYVQVLPNERLRALQKKQFATIVNLQPRRGDILDRNGSELAISVAAYSLFADPKLIEKPRSTARVLARILGEPVSSVYAKLNAPQKRFVWISRRLSSSVRNQISNLHLAGIDFVEEPKRIYPNENLMSQILGYIGIEGRGLDGLEYRFDSELAGDSKKVAIQRDARGRPLVINGKIFSELPDGQSLELTIDREIQYYLEQELQNAVSAHEADGATGLVLDAQTSEILAMASLPTFNPNFSHSSEPEQRRNRTITDPIEPGSTLKTFTIAAGLKAHVIAPNTEVYCEKGSMKLGNRTIREADKKHAFEWLTVNEILQHSSNVGAAKIGLKVGPEALRATLSQFGFGERASSDFTGESRGILPPLPWREHLTATVAFGHSIAVTPLQMANAYASIANGGYLRRPFLVRAIRQKAGIREEVPAQDPLRQVLTQKEAQTLKYMLMAATSDSGTGLRARVAGFQVAGKTGTAQKADLKKKGYIPNAYISSFAGFLPAHDPKFVIYVAIDHPRKGYYGADVAAPVFSKVAEFAIRKSGLVPNLLTEKDVDPQLMKVMRGDLKKPESEPVRAVALEETDDKEGTTLPDLHGFSLREALRILKAHGLQSEVHGQGIVIESDPSAGRQIQKGQHVRLYLKESTQ